MGAGIVSSGIKFRVRFRYVGISLGSAFGICNVGRIIFWTDNVKLIRTDQAPFDSPALFHCLFLSCRRMNHYDINLFLLEQLQRLARASLSPAQAGIIFWVEHLGNFFKHPKLTRASSCKAKGVSACPVDSFCMR